MNRCPMCSRLYEAEIRFCPTDGAPLEPAPVPAPPAPTDAAARTLPVVVGVLVVALVALVGVMLWQQQRTSDTLSARATSAEAAAAEARTQADDQARAARAESERATAAASEADQALVERDEATQAAQSASAQAASARAAAPRAGRTGSPSAEPFGLRAIASVNSPTDGFLALRALPAASSALLVRIPNGTEIDLGTCNRTSGGTGDWCRARYAGRVGYVYDRYVQYRQID